MNPLQIDRRIQVLLSVNRALLGEVPPSLRGVTVAWDEHSIEVVAYFDGEIAVEDRESMECVLTEVIADFSPDPEAQYRLDCLRRDAPARMEPLRAWVYLRRESAAT
ncbi:MAG TPA: hypothetical protein VF590_12970 [Isosphaeraceae bacterium]|jgi:hypothetical protein